MCREAHVTLDANFFAANRTIEGESAKHGVTVFFVQGELWRYWMSLPA